MAGTVLTLYTCVIFEIYFAIIVSCDNRAMSNFVLKLHILR